MNIGREIKQEEICLHHRHWWTGRLKSVATTSAITTFAKDCSLHDQVQEEEEEEEEPWRPFIASMLCRVQAKATATALHIDNSRRKSAAFAIMFQTTQL